MNRRPSWRRVCGWLICIFLLAPVAVAGPLPESPSPRYVLDDAKWLDADAFTALDQKLGSFERETSSQVVVGIFPKLPEGEELSDFSQRLFDAWMPGQKGKDNGVLLLFFAEDRKLRIQTGYGMEGVLPDARASQIIRVIIVPRIQAGDRAGAVGAGVDAILSAVKGEYVADAVEESDDGVGWLLFALLVFFLLGLRFPVLFRVAEMVFSSGGVRMTGGGGGWGGGRSSGGGGFSGGGGRSGGGGASGGW